MPWNHLNHLKSPFWWLNPKRLMFQCLNPTFSLVNLGLPGFIHGSVRLFRRHRVLEQLEQWRDPQGRKWFKIMHKSKISGMSPIGGPFISSLLVSQFKCEKSKRKWLGVESCSKLWSCDVMRFSGCVGMAGEPNEAPGPPKTQGLF